ncbi:MAG: DUF1203 domain-containing protein [Sphingomonas sp.]|nr:DUF1203 domain-containing protein [Sphingomonas sp.]
MTYRVTGIDPAPFKALFGLSDDELADRGAVRMTVDSQTFPCRVSLTDRAIGETVLLVNHVSNDVANPYRATHAIFVTESDEGAAEYVDQVPPVFEKRVLSLRAFDRAGMMVDAALAQPGEADLVIRRLLEKSDVHHIDAHNATRGCFSARIDRSAAAA